MLEEFIGLRISNEQLDLIKINEFSNQEVIRELIELIPKFIKLMWDNQIETPAFFFTKEQEKILEKLIEKMKESDIL